jgi:ribonucleoside-diphosphate reductase subunit M2
MYKDQLASMWIVEEADLSKDVADWDKLSADEQFFLKNIIGFFASADGIVAENISTNFGAEIKLREAAVALRFQAMMEDIHADAYAILLETFVKDKAECARLIDAMRTVPSIKAKAEWAMQWMDAGSATLAERLVAFVCVEGISFQGSFCAIFWLKKRGLMPGLCFFNEMISRDEASHMRVGAKLYSMVDVKLPESRVHDIIRGAVDCEVEFITQAFSAALVGLNPVTMKQFIQATANVVCMHLGVASAYPGVVNPYEWMTLMDVDGKTNYFERRVSEYARGNTSSAGPGLDVDVDVFAGEGDF